MELTQFFKRRPCLWHVCPTGRADSLLDSGLLSTSSILDGCRLGPDERRRLEETRREKFEFVEHETLGTVRLSHNGPINLDCLRRCLEVGVDEASWFRELNRRVYLFPGLRPMIKFANRVGDLDVLELDTEGLYHRVGGRLSLCRFNSGSTPFLCGAGYEKPRGPSIYLTVDDWTLSISRLVEASVVGRVEGLADVLTRRGKIRNGSLSWANPAL